jgi:hypothetical protein
MTSAIEIEGVNAALAADEEGLFGSEFSNVALAGNNISVKCSSWQRRCMGRIGQIS